MIESEPSGPASMANEPGQSLADPVVGHDCHADAELVDLLPVIRMLDRVGARGKSPMRSGWTAGRARCGGLAGRLPGRPRDRPRRHRRGLRGHAEVAQPPGGPQSPAVDLRG